MTDIFEEVEENMRQDKAAEFFRRYGGWIIAGVILLVGSVGAVSAWQAFRKGEADRASVGFLAAQEIVQKGDWAAAEAALAPIAKSGPEGYRLVADLERAGVAVAKGDTKAALALFDSVAVRASDPTLKASAQLRAAYLAAESESFDKLEARLAPLIAAKTTMSYLARELLAVEAYEAGKVERARTEFGYLETAIDAPQGVRERAQNLLVVVGPAAAPAAPSTAPAAAETGVKKQ